MGISEIFKQLKGEKKRLALIVLLGVGGLFLILLSSLLPEEKEKQERSENKSEISVDSEQFLCETEKKLTDFLESIDGVGDAEVYLTVSGGETYVYAQEGKTSVSENKREEEHKYVMIGGSGEKTALVESVQLPMVSGAVIACSGGDSPIVCEQVYKAVSAALGIPTVYIYVTKLK